MAPACSPRASCAGRCLMSAARRCPQGRRRDPVRPEARAASRRARGKRLRGAAPSLPDRDFTGGSEGRPRSGFVETVTLQQHRARPGRPAPSPTRRESRRRRVMPQTSPSPLGEGRRRAAPTGWGGLGNASTGAPRAAPLPPGCAFGSATLPRGGRENAPTTPSLPGTNEAQGRHARRLDPDRSARADARCAVFGRRPGDAGAGLGPCGFPRAAGRGGDRNPRRS